MELSFTLSEIDTAARALYDFIGNKPRVIAMRGEMGVGKTTFAHAFCNVLGVKDVVNSPTFSIINTYETFDGTAVYHLDLYRLGSAQEAIDAGVEDVLFSGKFCLVEWPEIAAVLLPDDTLHLHFSLLSANERKIIFN